MKKKFLIVCILVGVLIAGSAGLASARDFMGDFVQENYQETQAQFSYDPLIYHSIQVNTGAGPKLLILEGKDYSYRKWLRHYIALEKKLIIRVEDERNDEFITSKAFSLDVRSIHPVDGDKWSVPEANGSRTDPVIGNNHILIVDSHQKRTRLIKTVIEKMGYQAMIFKTGDQAIVPFKLQPARFRMIIVSHESINSLPGNFVDQVLKIDPAIPVIISTGYKNKALKNQFAALFSNAPSVFIRPVILQELSQTIQKLIRNNA